MTAADDLARSRRVLANLQHRLRLARHNKLGVNLSHLAAEELILILQRTVADAEVRIRAQDFSDQVEG